MRAKDTRPFENSKLIKLLAGLQKRERHGRPVRTREDRADEKLDAWFEIVALFWRALLALGLAQTRTRAAPYITAASLPAVYKCMGGCALMEKAFQLYAGGGHHNSLFLYQLASVFHDAFNLTGDIGGLDYAIQLYRELLDMQPEGHIHRYSSLNALGKALRAHSEKTGQPEHIEETILIHKEALALTREGEHSWHSACYKLSLSLVASYKHTRRYAHLEEAIGIRERALDLRPVEDPDRPQSCSQLAVLLLTQFRYTGDGLALDRAIVLHREALAFTPEAHPYRYARYRALGRSLVARSGRTGTHLVLNEAIENYRQALALTPRDHPSRYWSCMNLAESLCILFKVSTIATSPSKSPLPEAIELYREALDLHCASQGHKDRSYYNLAESLSLRFSEIGDDAIEREALQLHQKALDLRPEGHRRRNISCYALAICLRRRFPEDRGSKADKMLGLLDEALRLGTRADPLCWRILLARAEIFRSLGRHDEAVSDLHDVLSSPQHDIPELLAGSLELLALISLDDVSSSHLEDLLLTYSDAVDLLFVSTGFALDRSSQLQRVAGGTNIGARAFAVSRCMGDLHAGLAVLEGARGVIWSQALHTRNPQLDGVPPDLQKKLQDILRATSLTQFGEWDSEDIESSHESETLFSTQDVLHQQHTQLQHIISDIRGLPGLRDFMRGPNVPALLATASKNPVVVLIANGSECHALVIRSPHEPMVAIPLDISTKALQELILTGSTSMRGAPASSEFIEDSQRAMHISKRMSASHTTLAKIWRAVVQPVIMHLQLAKGHGRARPRIHWCPTGAFAFVPVHAAGIYHGSDQECCSDYFVSSYTPTLTALLRAQQGAVVYNTHEVRVAAIAAKQAHNKALRPLQYVVRECEQLVESAGTAGVSATFLNQSISKKDVINKEDVISKEDVIASIQTAHIVHLACHGIQHDSEPHESHFCLGSGNLTVSDLMGMNLGDAFFAFLSACETAKGDRKHADEAVHLAATMMFAGFKSVVATMWAMGDRDGPDITEWFYKKLFAGKTVDVDTVAYALDYAVSQLRARGDVPPERWATFIHMGA